MACRVCSSCPLRWPVRHCFLTCPWCGAQTVWSSAHPTATADDERRADKVRSAVVELSGDLAQLEAVTAHSPRLLSFADAFSEHWPTASDVPGPYVQGGAGGVAHPAEDHRRPT